jgi:hypothetical protein
MATNISSIVQGGFRKCISSVSSSSRLVRSRHGDRSRPVLVHLFCFQTMSPKNYFLSTSTDATFDDAVNRTESDASVPINLDPPPGMECSMHQSPPSVDSSITSTGTSTDQLRPSVDTSTAPADFSLDGMIDILPPDIIPSRGIVSGVGNLPPTQKDGAFGRRHSAHGSQDFNPYQKPLLRAPPMDYPNPAPRSFSPNAFPVEEAADAPLVDSMDIADRLLKRKKSLVDPGAVPPEKIPLTQALSRLSWRESLWKASNRLQACTVGEQLIQQGDMLVPSSTWVLVENISPISSLEAILQGIQEALDAEEIKGIVDLNKSWSNGEPLPMMDLSMTPVVTAKSTNSHKWVRKAKLVLSPFGRPTGWYLQFDNQSIVYALLNHSKDNTIRCTWREVRVREYKSMETSVENGGPVSQGNWLLNESISDNTLRVENCPYQLTEASMLNFFSRYDLKPGCKAIELWHGVTMDGKICPPTTYLVHFADASWARAAIREKQNTYMYKLGEPVKDYKNPKPLRLVQYPRQML